MRLEQPFAVIAVPLSPPLRESSHLIQRCTASQTNGWRYYCRNEIYREKLRLLQPQVEICRTKKAKTIVELGSISSNSTLDGVQKDVSLLLDFCRTLQRHNSS